MPISSKHDVISYRTGTTYTARNELNCLSTLIWWN